MNVVSDMLRDAYLVNFGRMFGGPQMDAVILS